MIQTLNHLAYTLRTNINTINSIIANIDNYYLTWDKPKLDKKTGKPIIDEKTGKPKVRTLNSTKKELKTIQKRIYKFLLKNIELPQYAFGGIPKRDNILNAKFHQGHKYIFTTDIQSFFPTITHKQVFDLFREYGFSPTVSRVLTQLTTYKYELPQGVPTSTLLANLVFKKTGDRIIEYIKDEEIIFSIFVDDITLSSKKNFKDKTLHILRIISDDGYKISHKKTYYKTKNPIITGIKCQNNQIKLQQSSYKRLKALKVSIDEKDKNRYNGLFLYKQRINKINSSKNILSNPLNRLIN